MRPVKNKKLAAAGWVEGSVQDFLGLSDAEMAFIEIAVEIATAFRRKRRESGTTQQEIAARMGSSQSRVAKIEAGDPSVSLDLAVSGLLALGMSRKDLGQIVSGRKAGASTVAKPLAIAPGAAGKLKAPAEAKRRGVVRRSSAKPARLAAALEKSA